MDDMPMDEFVARVRWGDRAKFIYQHCSCKNMACLKGVKNCLDGFDGNFNGERFTTETDCPTCNDEGDCIIMTFWKEL